MPFFPADIPPGVVKVDSDYAATGRWIDMDKVRFVRGKAEKLGGIQKLTEDSYSGIPRGAKAWNTFLGIQCLGFGTACSFHIYREGTIFRVTPFRADAIGLTLTDPFTTVDGSAVVTVSDVAHGIAEAGTLVAFSGASAVGGITIDGEYAVTAIVDNDSFTITHSTAASSAATGGGTVSASYEINCGNVDPAYLLGWGVGLWGQGYWGTDVSLASAILSEPMVWSMDTYGEDLVLNPLNGAIYVYDADAGAQRPSLLAGAPTQVRFTFVTPERYIFALGCNDLFSGNQDSMIVRWPDIEDNTDWSPSSVNTANQRRLQGGTRLMAGAALSDGVSLIWSDAACFLFQFTGSNEVYASRQIATNCGIIAPHAFTKSNGMAFWMGSGNLWMYTGYVQPIPNVEDIRSWLFRNLNKTHAFKAFATYNPMFNEVWFFFPAGVSKEPNWYVAVNLDDWSWIHGSFDRSAGAAFTSGEARPMMLGNGRIYVHDVVENPDTDGSPMAAHIELAPTDIDGGNTCVDIYGFVPDFQRQAGAMSLYIYGRDHPRDSDINADTVVITPADVIGDTRSAGRQFGMKLSTNTLGGDFRLGRFGLEVSGAGKKRGSSG